MKRLVVCCDGTWNSRDQRNHTNVLKLRDAVRVGTVAPDTRQLPYYQEGVGSGPGIVNKLMGGLFGAGLWLNVQKAYRFVVDYYDSGDEIWIFGFSRGAYTARSVAGMIRKCGILRRDQIDFIQDAYDFYRSEIKPDDVDAIAFRDEHSVVFPDKAADSPDRCVPSIKFVGVWDTVGSLGVPLRFFQRKHQFHDVALSRTVENAYHAIAIDEQRKQFRPTLWEQHPLAINQTMEQRWFAGVHTNIGGGAGTTRQSDRVLLWMLKRAQDAGLAADIAQVQPPIDNLSDGAIGDSLVTRIWHTLFRFVRPIGQGVPDNLKTYAGTPAERSHERVDPAVLTRKAYTPSNLIAYFEEDPSRRDTLSHENTAVWP